MILRKIVPLAVLLAVSSVVVCDSAFAKQKQKEMMKIGDEIVETNIGRAFVHAQELMDGKQYQQAADELKALVDKAPSVAPIRYKYGFTLIQLHQFDEAQVQAKKCTELKPDFVGGWALLGEAAEGLNLDAQAVDAYNKALTLQPSGENADIMREHIAAIQNEKQQAVQAQEDAAANAKINEQNKASMRLNQAIALCSEGKQLGAQRKFEDGMQKFRDALKIAPDNNGIREAFAGYINNYAADCVQHQQLPQAEALMKEAIAFQKQGGVSAKSQLVTLKNYTALLNFLGRTDEAKVIEAQMKSVSSAN